MKELNCSLAARSYLDEYVRLDKPCMDAIRIKTDLEMCVELRHMAIQYNIDRNFSCMGGDGKKIEGAARYKFAVSKLRSYPNPETNSSATKTVDDFALYLKKHYGKLLLSAASKLLWMRFQTPVIIWDRLAREWLESNAGLQEQACYTEFCGAWRREYAKHKDDIAQTCHEILRFKKFTRAWNWEDQDLKELLSKEWFRERVFDHSLVLSMSQ